MNDATSAAVRPAALHTPRLGWPPPGLEHMQGSVWSIIAEFCIGVAILALPLLLAIATPQDFWSFGAFGQSWWIPMATTLLAFVILVSASWHLSRLLRSAAAASRLGYGIGTIAIVATDNTKDSGFVLQGARHFSTMQPNERRMLLAIRVTSALCYLTACLWIPLGLAVSIFIAATGPLSNASVWFITLIPAVAIAAVGTIARLFEHFIVKRLKRTTADTTHADIQREAFEWGDNLQLIADEAALGSRHVMKPRALSIMALAVVIPAILLLGPVATVTTSAAMGPVLVMVNTPHFTTLMEKFTVADALREYRLPIDSAITPAAAGMAIANLGNIGDVAPRDRLMREPAKHFPAWPVSSRTNDMMMEAGNGALFAKASTLTPEMKTYLAAAAAHPSNSEYAILAGALHADVAGARLVLPLPDTISAFNIPIARFGKLRESAYMHVGKAVYEFSQGRSADAEHTIKEVISAGYLMLNEGTFLIESLIGNVIMGIGTNALEKLYRASGRVAEADALIAKRSAAERAAKLSHQVDAQPTASSGLRMMMETAANPDVVRSLRWEYFINVNTVASCLNLRNVVYGPGADYDAWIAKTRSTLVRYPADAEVFAVAQSGLLGTKSKPSNRCLPSGKFLRIAREFSLN